MPLRFRFLRRGRIRNDGFFRRHCNTAVFSVKVGLCPDERQLPGRVFGRKAGNRDVPQDRLPAPDRQHGPRAGIVGGPGDGEVLYQGVLQIAEQRILHPGQGMAVPVENPDEPLREVAEIAVETVTAYREETGSSIQVVFNVFKDEDLAIYRELLGV